MATGLARSILARARDLMWDWTIFINPFQDPISHQQKNSILHPHASERTL